MTSLKLDRRQMLKLEAAAIAAAAAGMPAPALAANLITEQPVPQKRQAALSHFSSEESRSATRLAASAGAGIPAAAAAIAAATSFSIWRRSSFGEVMMALPSLQVSMA